MIDYPENYKPLNIKFRHVASGQEVEFLPFINSFEDSYEQQWNPVEVFGKMDAIKNFKRTMRIITLGFDVPSEDHKEGEANLEKCKKLIQMNYPVYQKTVDGIQSNDSLVNDPLMKGIVGLLENDRLATKEQKKAVSNLQKKLNSYQELFEPNSGVKDTSIISAPPILQIKLGNLINDATGGYLYGTIQGMTYAPDIEMGFWTFSGKGKKFSDKEVGYVPKVVSFNITFEVMHTNPLGFDSNQRGKGNILFPRTRSFPYNK